MVPVTEGPITECLLYTSLMTSLILQHFSRDERHREHDRHWGSIRQEEGGHSPRDRTSFGNRGRSVKKNLNAPISMYFFLMLVLLGRTSFLTTFYSLYFISMGTYILQITFKFVGLYLYAYAAFQVTHTYNTHIWTLYTAGIISVYHCFTITSTSL